MPAIAEIKDRGRERDELAPPGKPRLSKRALRKLKTERAIKEMSSPSLEAFRRAVEAIEKGGRCSQLYDQLSQIQALTSIALPASPGLLGELEKTVDQTHRARAHPEMPMLLSKMGGEFAQALRSLISPEDGQRQRAAITAKRSLRDHSIIADETIKQLLWRIQNLGGVFSFKGFGSICESAGEALISDQLGNQAPLMDQVAEELFLAKVFIETTEGGIRRGRGYESPRQAERRAVFLHQAMAVLAHEYIVAHGDEEGAARYVAQQLVEGHFAHQIHWVDPKRQVIHLCEELLNPTVKPTFLASPEEIMAQFLLAAQQAQLVNPGEITEADYGKLGLDHRLFAEHQKRLLNPVQGYVEDSLPFVPEGTAVMTIRGYFNFPHLGYRALIRETQKALNRFYPRPNGWTIVVSINRRDLEREKRALSGNDPPALPLETRIPLVERGLAGILSPNVIFTSIEPEPLSRDEMTPSLLKFADRLRRERGVQIVGRSCGFDRVALAPHELDPLYFALRGADLRKLLQDRGTMERLKAAFPTNEVVLLLLSGVMTVSSSRVYREARKFIRTGKERHLWELKSIVHRNLVDPILELVGTELENRGEI